MLDSHFRNNISITDHNTQKVFQLQSGKIIPHAGLFFSWTKLGRGTEKTRCHFCIS